MRARLNWKYRTPLVGEAVQPPPEANEKDVWLAVCVAVARSENAKEATMPAAWANKAADAFVARFGRSK